MKSLLENSKYIVLLAVVSTLLGAVALFTWATVKMGIVISHLVHDIANLHMEGDITHIVAILDSYLLAIVLYIFSMALYELFLGPLDLPDWLIIKDLDDLKKKLSSVIVLMLAVIFLEHLSSWSDPKGTLMFAASVGIVISVLVFYMNSKEK